MSKLFGGSICLTDLVEQARKGHSAFTKSPKNGKVYCNIVVWENDQEDKYGHTHAFQLSSTKEKREAEGKIYFGNVKPIESKTPANGDLPKDDWDSSVPTREGKKDSVPSPSDITEPIDDLPF